MDIIEINFDCQYGSFTTNEAMLTTQLCTQKCGRCTRVQQDSTEHKHLNVHKVC